MGMLADKDSASSINLLEGLFEEVFTVTVNNPRTLSAEELAEKCKQHFPKVEAFDNNKKALETALDKAKNENMPLVICGSLYLAGELRPYLSENG
jgi:dihydrofolate synthase/folylpolyglutamate synthase